MRHILHLAYRYSHMIFLLIFSLMMSGFLLDPGIWLLQDNSYLAKTPMEVSRHMYGLFSSLWISDYFSPLFGFDALSLGVSRWGWYSIYLWLSYYFGCDIGQWTYIFLFFLLGGYITYLFLLIVSWEEKTEKTKIMAMLLSIAFMTTGYTLFNIQLGWFIYCIFWFQLFYLSMHSVVHENQKRYISYLWVIVSIWLMFSYFRLFLLYLPVAFVIFIYSIKKLSTKTITVVVISCFFATLPVSFALISKLLWSETVGSTSWYADEWYNLHLGWSYGYHSTMPFFHALQGTMNTVAPFTISSWSISTLNIFFILVLLGWVILTYIKKNTTKQRNLFIGLLIIICIINIWHFTTKESFWLITYKYLPMLANCVEIIKIYSLLLFYALILIASITWKKYTTIIVLLIGWLIITNSIPFWTYNKKQFVISNAPEIYQNHFFDTSISPKEASKIYPNSGTPISDSYWLVFDWTPFPLEPFTGKKYTPMTTKNSRLVDQKHILLQRKLDQDKAYTNIRILNLKNVFVFKNLRNPDQWEFNYFLNKNYIEESLLYSSQLRKNSWLNLINDNSEFTQFRLRNADQYEYMLYAPGQVVHYDMDEFFSWAALDIRRKPINISPMSSNKNEIKNKITIPESNKNIFIEYKYSDREPTKIYVKMTNFDAKNQFLLQYNQTFSTNWKVKWIIKEDFESKWCITTYSEYPITQNKACQYEPTPLSIWDTKYLFSPQVSWGHHFEWNFIGNSWMIPPEDIPENMRWQKELYAVIIYEKQIWYSYTLLLSGLTFLILLLATIVQESKSYLSKRKTYD